MAAWTFRHGVLICRGSEAPSIHHPARFRILHKFDRRHDLTPYSRAIGVAVRVQLVYTIAGMSSGIVAMLIDQ